MIKGLTRYITPAFVPGTIDPTWSHATEVVPASELSSATIYFLRTGKEGLRMNKCSQVPGTCHLPGWSLLACGAWAMAMQLPR